MMPIAAISTCFSFLVCSLALSSTTVQASDAKVAPATPAQVFVVLSEAPATGSGEAGAAQSRRVIAEQTQFVAAMTAHGLHATIVYRVQHARNGMAVTLPSTEIDVLRKLPGVKSVEIIVPEHVTGGSSATSVSKRSCHRNHESHR